MNERIQELSDIAYENHLARNPNSSFGRRTDYDREFAELIVKECADVGSRAMYPDSDPDYVGREIKQHFGVKE